jgi:beta-lactamase class A
MGQASPKNPRRRIVWRFYLIAAIACAVFFAAGWFLKGEDGRVAPPLPLRLTGYQFISPLLTCNLSNPKIFPEDQAVNNALQTVIGKHQRAGDISKASVYFGDFSTGQWSIVNGGDTYYPSSLGKVPIMMAYYLEAESSTDILAQKITFPIGSPDLNQSQDIAPAHAIVPGQAYSVEQLIEYMIEDSDNNAAQLLYENIDQNALRGVYEDLQIPFQENVTLADADFITPEQIGVLFRVLYNSTYLSRDYSEKALELMSRSSFNQGIVAGTPSSTVVAHKLGLVVITQGGITTEHELHDCGIVYAPGNSYLLCVMTRGSSSLGTMEGTIADIASAAYQQVEK